MKQTKVTFEDVDTGNQLIMTITGDIKNDGEAKVSLESKGMPLMEALDEQHGLLCGMFGESMGEIIE